VEKKKSSRALTGPRQEHFLYYLEKRRKKKQALGGRRGGGGIALPSAYRKKGRRESQFSPRERKREKKEIFMEGGKEVGRGAQSTFFLRGGTFPNRRKKRKKKNFYQGRNKTKGF